VTVKWSALLFRLYRHKTISALLGQRSLVNGQEREADIDHGTSVRCLNDEATGVMSAARAHGGHFTTEGARMGLYFEEIPAQNRPVPNQNAVRGNFSRNFRASHMVRSKATIAHPAIAPATPPITKRPTVEKIIESEAYDHAVKNGQDDNGNLKPFHRPTPYFPRR